MSDEPLDQRLDNFEGEWGCLCYLLMEEAANRIRELESELAELKFPQKWATENSLPDAWPGPVDDIPYKPPSPAALEAMKQWRDEQLAATKDDVTIPIPSLDSTCEHDWYRAAGGPPDICLVCGKLEDRG